MVSLNNEEVETSSIIQTPLPISIREEVMEEYSTINPNGSAHEHVRHLNDYHVQLLFDRH